eukprot:maker-scaffold674_size113878-snap-gene-0.18 protein:Tk09019 transcript:maker-scaffold674_size113878-snap-gene-0.18-mRNA-1 annotation:"3-demethylubiquinone-9 3-methyltransferase"
MIYNNFGHHETRHGGNNKGSYHVKLPNGKLQTVNYHVDGYSGYVAKLPNGKLQTVNYHVDGYSGYVAKVHYDH